MQKFATVATFTDEIEAHLAQATLAAAGIESFIQMDDGGGMLQVLEYSKGVKLLVDENNEEEARAVLTTPASENLTP